MRRAVGNLLEQGVGLDDLQRSLLTPHGSVRGMWLLKAVKGSGLWGQPSSTSLPAGRCSPHCCQELGKKLTRVVPFQLLGLLLR